MNQLNNPFPSLNTKEAKELFSRDEAYVSSCRFASVNSRLDAFEELLGAYLIFSTAPAAIKYKLREQRLMLNAIKESICTYESVFNNVTDELERWIINTFFLIPKYDQVEQLEKKIIWLRKLLPKKTKDGVVVDDNHNQQYEKQVELARAVPIESILAMFNIKTIPSSNDSFFFKVRNEKTPSAHASRRKNVWYDHGSGKGGDGINLYMTLAGTDFRHAVRELCG